MKPSLAIFAPVLALAAAWLAAPPAARAGTIVETVTVNTSSFVGSANPFEVYFTLTDGSGTGDGNNAVNLTGFDFGAGGAGGAVDAANTVNASGDLIAGVSMNDATFSDTFAAFFTPGSSLGFTLSDTFSGLDAPTPDELAFALIDNGAPLNTTDPSGNGNLVTLTLDSETGTTALYTDTNTLDSVGTPNVGAPLSTPEPPGWMLLAAGLGLLLGLAPWRRNPNAG